MGMHCTRRICLVEASARPSGCIALRALRRVPAAPTDRLWQGRAISALPDDPLHHVNRGAYRDGTPCARTTGADAALSPR